ncbi:MAG TPA: transglycosylase SLT domain-containing protein [Bordetella sp.]
MTLIRNLLLLLLVLLAGCAGIDRQADQTSAMGVRIARNTSRTIDLTHPPHDAWDRIRRGFAIPNLDNDLSQQWTEYYAAHPEAVERMAQRAGKYLYFIIDEVNRRGLPTELALLPFVESAYNPTAQSPAQASGLWQFVPATGEHYNLKQDWWRDERRDPIASTYAALDYLAELFEMQGDWYLALASYNWGENAVQRAIARNQSLGLPTDYLSLDMPDETRNYVPKLQAIKNIISNPEKYAVTLPPVENTPYFAMISEPGDMDLEIAARLAEMPLDEFKALNPSYKRPVINGQENSTLLLPKDKVEVFNHNFANYQGRLSNWRIYQPQRGEKVASVARHLGISELRLRQLNGIAPHAKTVSGQNLLVPAGDVGDSAPLALAAATDGDSEPVDPPPAHAKTATGRKQSADHHASRARQTRGTARKGNAKAIGKLADKGRAQAAGRGGSKRGAQGTKGGRAVKVASADKKHPAKRH